MKVTIAIPTYNEAENIGSLIESIFRDVREAYVIVIDDGSPDGTAAIVRSLQERFPSLALLERPGKQGLASAYMRAFRDILKNSDVEWIITMDADFSHHPRYISELLKETPEHDLIIGSRYVPGGAIKNWSMRRRFLSRIGNLYARLVLGLAIRDMTAGFMCLRTSFLRAIPWPYMRAEGYAWLIELKTVLAWHGARVKEVPIIFEERKAGSSKISRNIIFEGIVYPLRLRLSACRHKQ